LASGFAHGHLVEMNDAETIARLKQVPTAVAAAGCWKSGPHTVRPGAFFFFDVAPA
jgi:hypothetical protein